jgi:ADP-heptose:LPS heptosyltransferase
LAALKKIKYIVRKRALGDVLWIEPVIRAMAGKYRKIIVHTRYNELFENYPLSNVFFKDRLSFWERGLILIEKKLGMHLFTLDLDGAYEARPALHPLHAYQQKAGLAFTREYPKIFLSEDEKKKAVEEQYAVLHIQTFSDKKYRQLQGIDWNKISAWLYAKGFKIIQTGEKDAGLEQTVYTRTSIRQLIRLIGHASLFVGIDSGPSHIAAGLSIPSMILFGALDPSLRHFPELFPGILMKQPCGKGCSNIISDQEDHRCALVSKDQIPPCCFYSDEIVLFKLQTLVQTCSSRS